MEFKINKPQSGGEPAKPAAPQQGAGPTPPPQTAMPAATEDQSPATSDDDILQDLAREKVAQAVESAQAKEAAREKFKEEAKSFFPRMAKRLALLAAEKPKQFAVLIIAVVVVVVAIASIPSVTLAIYRSQAMSAFEEGDFESATKSFNFYTGHREDDLEALHLLGVSYMKIGMPQEAKAIFATLLLDHNYTDADADFHYYHGLASLPVRADAVKRLDLALTTDPSHLPSLVARGFLIGNQPIEQSIADLEKALQIANDLTVDNRLTARDDLSELHRFLLSDDNQLFRAIRPPQAVLLPSVDGQDENPIIGLGSFDNRYGFGLRAAAQDDTEIRSKTLTLLYYALLLFQIEEYEKAEQYLSEAAELQPGVNIVGSALAAAMAVRGNYAGAVEIYAQLTQKLPDDSGMLVNLANAQVAAGGNEADAIKIYDSALAIASDNFIALNNRGLLKMRADDLDGAAADFDAAITAVGGALPPRYNIALVRWRRGETAEAIEELKRVASDDTAFGGVLSVLGRFYYEIGNGEESLKALARHRELYPADPAPYLVSAELHRKQGSDLLAENVLKEGLKNAPGDGPLSLELASIYAATDRVEEAAGLLSNVSTSGGVSETGLRLVKGDILWLGGDQKGGLAEYRIAHRNARGDKERLASSIRLGRALIETDGDVDVNRIAQVLETGLAADPTNPDLRVLQAMSLMAQKRVNEALLYAAEAAGSAPERADLNIAVGNIFRTAKQSRKALSYYRIALDLSPGDVNTLKLVLAMQRATGDNAGAEETSAQLRRISGDDAQTAQANGGQVEVSDSAAGRQLETEFNEAIKAGNLEDAASILSELIDRYGAKAVWLQNRGLIYLNLKDYENAILDLEESLRFSGDAALSQQNIVPGYLNLAAAHAGAGNFRNSADAYGKAIELNPNAENVVDLIYRRGIANLQAKRFDQSLADFARVAELKPDFDDAYFRRGGVFLQQKKYPEAVAEFTKVIRVNPQSVKGYRARAQTHQLMGEINKAQKDLETAKALAGN